MIYFKEHTIYSSNYGVNQEEQISKMSFYLVLLFFISPKCIHGLGCCCQPQRGMVAVPSLTFRWQHWSSKDWYRP